nr:RNA methyltransferase [Desulfobacterales bacterium]
MKSCLQNFFVVLVRTRFPENIGSAARCVANMGLGGIIAVSPENPDREKMLKLATHKAAFLIENMDIHNDILEALSGFNYVVGTTSRTGRGYRSPVITPRTLAREIWPIAENNRVALLFGPEDKGLSNREILLCQRLVRIPTASLSSLNLAQAVMILAYELFVSKNEEPETEETKRASIAELEGMFDHLKEAFIRIHYIDNENPDYWMMKIRRFFNKRGLNSNEVRLIRGFCRHLLWIAGRYGL